MADDQDKDSKTEAPTGRRLELARHDGDVAKSPEVASTLALAAAALVCLTAGGGMARAMALALTPFIAHPDAIDLSGLGGVAVLRAAVAAAAPGLAILGAAAAAGVMGNLIQHGVLFTPKKIAPDFSKLSPAQGLKRLIGVDNLISFAKSLGKLAAMTAVVFMVMKPRAQSLAALAWTDPVAILPSALEGLRALLLAGVAVFGVSAAADYFIQRVRFTQRLRMSREDLKQEAKDSEGDPHLKAKVKQLRLVRAKKRMIQNVPKATLVIMNPTHFAVALRYVQGETPAPLCVAKGLDEVALRIREVAQEHRIAIVENPPLARALYAVVEVDETIPREHYQAVAKVVGFVMGAAKRRARAFPPRAVPSETMRKASNR